MIISIDAERVFDRILFMVEILNRVGIVGIYLNVIKGVLDKLIANVTVNGQKFKCLL